MNRIKQVLILSIAFLILYSCSKNEEDKSKSIPTNEDYLIFGNIYGACTGDCKELFLLTKEYLYEDSNKPEQEVTFNAKPLAAGKFYIADTLFSLPQAILSNSIEQDELIQIIADFDYYINGKVNGIEFKLIYDDIDSTKNEELYKYSQIVKYVIDQIK